MAGIEEDQHQIRQLDDVIRDAQGGGALGVGVEPGGIDQNLARSFSLGQVLSCR